LKSIVTKISTVYEVLEYDGFASEARKTPLVFYLYQGLRVLSEKVQVSN
jgi:hypothetical protein